MEHLEPSPCPEGRAQSSAGPSRALRAAAACREASEEGEPAWRAAQLAAQAKPAPAAPAPRKEREKTEREKQSTRDWILQYAQEDSGSDNGSKQVIF